MNQPDTIKQRTIPVPLADGGTLVVRRLYWKAARTLLIKLAAALAGRADLLQAGSGTVRLDLDQIIARLGEIITSTDELAQFLLVNSTDVEEAAIDKLDTLDALAALTAAVRLNLGTELKNSLAGIEEALAPLLAEMKTSNGAAPTRS